MLVLSRKSGQELIIGDNIRITVNRVGGSRVTLGIEAPDDVRIVRGELDPIVRSFEQTSEESCGGQQADSRDVHDPTVDDRAAFKRNEPASQDDESPTGRTGWILSASDAALTDLSRELH